MKDGPGTRKISAKPAPGAPLLGEAPRPGAAWDGSAPVLAARDAMSASNLLAGAYQPLVELASGGMARVTVGRRVAASGFERLVVIKQVHRHLLGKEDFANFFRDEARIASQIHHANVVPVIDVVEAQGELLLVMEYVESVSLSLLRKRVKEAKLLLPAEIASRILLDMLAGLHAAHELVDGEGRALQVVHRDVSPQNVIVGVDGVSRLIDFGVAKAAHRLTETESGDIKGKYGYMSPEQVSGIPVDRRSDVFSAAVVLFETLTETRLFAGEHAMETMRRVVDASLPDLGRFGNIPPALHPVLAAGLERNRDRRFPTAAAFAEALEATVPPASHRKVAEWVGRHCGDLLVQRRSLLDESRRAGGSSPNAVSLFSTGSVPHLGETTESRTMSAESVTLERTTPKTSGRSTALAVGALVAMLAVIGGTLTVLAVRVRAPAPVVHTPVQPPTAPAQPDVTSTAEGSSVAPAAATLEGPAVPDTVVLEVHAEGPIRSVRAKGLREVQLRGTSARLVVTPWAGELRVDAELDGKRAAHAVVAAGASRATLTTVAAPTKRPAAAPKNTVPKGDELQGDPYGGS